MKKYSSCANLKRIEDINSLFEPLSFIVNQDIRLVEIELNLSQVEFISPLGAVSLLLLLDKLNHSKLKIIPPKEQVISYMDRMNFFKNCPAPAKLCFKEYYDLEYYSKRRRNDASNVLLEITPIKAEEDINNIFESILHILCNNGMGSREANRIAVIASELGTNILDHSQGLGFAAIQCYPQRNQVNIGIGDNGIGIVNALKPSLVKQLHHNEFSDLDVIKLAFKERTSSKVDADRGMGLSISREKSFYKTKQTNFYVKTHKGTYQISNNNIHTICEDSYFPGTYISLEICF
ncbi:hypothetical protein MUG87_19185 [Ectobacillus sp. JY-23]|uniref:hypothetical protein n=1 Tax=Ectobacillus sp. JY-23 TaxID=2933872 RepID=UPI001FF0F8EC|nr:hypothetical protein [Ectobacillus sp. JY-23]UOY92508.1 hypothetical protein MUG87_19185 [Ectobacillus sp. JY-23]